MGSWCGALKSHLLEALTGSAAQLCFGNERWLLLINPIRCKNLGTQTMGTDQPHVRSEGISWIGFVSIRGEGYWVARMSSRIKEPAWRHMHFWKEFQNENWCHQWLMTLAEPLNGLPKESSPKTECLCSVLTAFTLPILLTKLLHWRKGNFTVWRVFRFWDGILQWE